MTENKKLKRKLIVQSFLPLSILIVKWMLMETNKGDARRKS